MPFDALPSPVVSLGKLVASEFKLVAGRQRTVHAMGVAMQDGRTFVAATNNGRDPVGLIFEKLQQVYGEAANNMDHMIANQAHVITISATRTVKSSPAQDCDVRINGKPHPMAWTAFTS